MQCRDFKIFLGLQIFAILWAGLVFSILTNHRLAGALAGGYFVITGLFMLYRTRHWPRKWHSLTIYVLLIHVFLISIPMLAARAWQLDADFTDVRIWGLSGPVFHKISSGVFSALIGALFIDRMRAGKAEKPFPRITLF